jgi:Spy/CpxP family protein refolding chaperone
MLNQLVAVVPGRCKQKEKKMKRAKKKVMVGTAVALTLLFVGGSVLYANLRPKWGGGFFNPEEHAEYLQYRLTKELDLDASQQQELQNIVQDLLEKGRTLHELRTTSRQEVLSMLRGNSIDRQRIENLRVKHQERIGEFLAVAGDRLADFLSMLTAEQKQRLADAIEKHHGCRHFYSE